VDRSARGTESESRFASYVEHVASALGHADRRTPFRSYCAGLILPGERKSVEPMAARVEPRRVQGAHQSLHHFVANADWSQEALLREVRTLVLPAIEKSGKVRAWIVDDTGFPKKGVHSVGVARQYCGQLGKQDNCQIAVSLSAANDHASLPIAFRLYLPESWAADPVRRAKAGVPDDVVFRTKPQIALDQIRAARDDGVSEGTVLADAGYRNDTKFRTALNRMNLTYVVGVQSSVRLWPPGAGPLPPKEWTGQGRPPTLMRRDAQHKPVSAEQLAKSLPADAWSDVAWREGVDKTLRSRFAAVRVRPAHRDTWRSQPHAEEWFLVEWPQDENAPTKYWLSTLPPDTPIATLVDTAKLRWRIERDYQELKQELGLDHYEGRGWRGFHHHMALCVAAYGFLVSERRLIPPSGPQTAFLEAPRLSSRYRPRGSADPTGTPYRRVNRNPAH
jgi:SRSO17 transposase